MQGWSEAGAADVGLRSALVAAELPIEDLDQSSGRFFRYERNGVLTGFGGFERYAGDALLRSVRGRATVS